MSWSVQAFGGYNDLPTNGLTNALKGRLTNLTNGS